MKVLILITAVLTFSIHCLSFCPQISTVSHLCGIHLKSRSKFPTAKPSRHFSGSHNSCRNPHNTLSTIMSGSVIDDIVVRKKVEVDALKANPPSEVAEMLAKIGKIKSKNIFLQAVKKPKGTVCVITQIKTKSPVNPRICSVIDPVVLGAHHYEAGASAIAVCTDESAFGFNYNTLRAVVKGQASYRGNYPGPLPVMAYDFFIDPIQLAQAAANGASAVCLNARILTSAGAAHGLKDMIMGASDFGMDAMVEVHGAEELAAAVAAGAKVVGVSNRDQDTWEPLTKVDYVTRELLLPMNETVFALVDSLPQDVVPVAMGAINETLVAWGLRDLGYSGVLVGEAIMKASETRMAGSAYQGAYNEAKGLIKAFKSKGSVKFGPSSTTSFYGKGEGAKETLGMISI